MNFTVAFAHELAQRYPSVDADDVIADPLGYLNAIPELAWEFMEHSGLCGREHCATHDIDLHDDEAEEWEDGFDPCLFVRRTIWPEPTA